MRDLQTSAMKGLLLVLIALVFQGCPQQQGQTLVVQLVEPIIVATPEGVKIETRPGKTLAYREVIEASPNVKSVTRLTENEDKNVVVGPPVLSPTEDVMVYWEMSIKIIKDADYGTRLSRRSNIYRQTIGSPAKTRITYGKRTDLYPAFSPNGKDIVFSSNRTGPNPTLWRISLAGGGGITKLTATMAEDYAPCVSPDNASIVYASNPPGADEPQIWTVASNGLLPTQLRVGRLPQLSPDGTKILFIRANKDTGRKQLWVMSIDGSEETQLTSNADFDIIHSRWSPDGKKIVYASDEGVDSRKRHNFDIWMMDSDATNITQLTTNGSRDDSPCCDHTGKFIYFRSNRGGTWNIWRFEPIMP